MARPHLSGLPPELLDHVFDFLHDSSNTLESCCLVSKSWIPCTRKYLIADIEFQPIDDLETWKAVFSDPSTSPAYYAKTLSIGCSEVIVAVAGTEEGCLVSAFSRVVDLTIYTLEWGSEQIAISLIPFTPILKSLRLHKASDTFKPSQISNLICSFPLLENLPVFLKVDSTLARGRNHGFDEQPAAIQPLSSPAFTGSLELFSCSEMDPFASQLLSLPNGLHFRKLDLTWHYNGDLSCATALVEGSCSTLESLKIDGGYSVCWFGPFVGTK